MSKATISTADHGVHKIRRAPLDTFFSGGRIRASEDVISQKAELVCRSLRRHQHSRKPCDLRLLFTCFATDVETAFILPESYELLRTQDLSPSWHRSLSCWLRNYHWFKHFPCLWYIIRAIPNKVLIALSADLRIVLDFEVSTQRLIMEAVESPCSAANIARPTVFREILNSSLPSEEKSASRMFQEVQSLIIMGTCKISNTLTVILYRLIETPTKLARLKSELDTLPDPDFTTYPQLQSLKFLSAVIQEGLRMAGGIASPHVRVAQHQDLRYQGQKIPAGTAVGMSSMALNNNNKTFPEPERFLPERWLAADRHFDSIAFSKGSRSCAGTECVSDKEI